jgi:hypothetical protein
MNARVLSKSHVIFLDTYHSLAQVGLGEPVDKGMRAQAVLCELVSLDLYAQLDVFDRKVEINLLDHLTENKI